MTEAEHLAQVLVERVREVAPDDEDFLASMRTSFLERYPGQEATWEAAVRCHKPPTAYADITVVFDRSASMTSMQTAVVDGFNEYVRRMRQTPGDSRWTLVQFDDRDSARGAGEEFPQVLFEGVCERHVPALTLAPDRLHSVGYANAVFNGIAPDTNEPTPPPSGSLLVQYVPRGGTALVDALCKTINRVVLRTSGQDDHVKRVMMVVTDGQENSSREFTSPQLRELVGRTQAQGWEYIYLGANQDSFAEAGSYGMGGNLSKYTTSHVASGGLCVGPETTAVNNYVPTSAGMRDAIFSGMVGLANVVSGSVASGRLTAVGRGE